MTEIRTRMACVKCGGIKFKIWSDLLDDEKTIARRLPDAANLDEDEIKRSSFCIRCWNVYRGDRSHFA